MIQSLSYVLKEHFENKDKVIKLAKKELQKKYKGSVLGMVWSIFRPLLFVSIYWFAIYYGFRSGSDRGDVPFIAWLVAGIAPWFFITDTLFYSANAIRSTSYLVTKMKFPISIIPTYRILAQFFVHLIFLAIAVVILLINGIKPSIYFIQLPYYMFALFIFLMTLSWLTSALVVISKDFEQFFKSITTVLFWTLPILWDFNILPRTAQSILGLNPMVYIIEGYRGALVGGQWFFTDVQGTIYFWCATLLLALIGSFFHVKLRPQFADVL